MSWEELFQNFMAIITKFFALLKALIDTKGGDDIQDIIDAANNSGVIEAGKDLIDKAKEAE